MLFTQSEKNAIAYVIEKMLYLGTGSIVEKATAHSYLYKIGYDPLNDKKTQGMIFEDAKKTIIPMSSEKKRLLFAILANIMVADRGEIHREKHKWLTTISLNCKVPFIMSWDYIWEILESFDSNKI